MIEKLKQYLILNEKANLPGIGSFTIEHVPARLDFINKTLYAPSPVIRFSKGLAEDDKYFCSFAANDTGENEQIVSRSFNDFIFDVKHKLSYHGEVVLEGLGTLKKDAGDNYSFEQKLVTENLFPPLIAERVIRNNANHTVRAGDNEHTSMEMQELLSAEQPSEDYWWVYALILAAAGGAVLAYYYFVN